ncbi:hypothetical protein KI387_030118, partial [Taxus chinensis]
VLSHKTYTDLCEALEATLRVETVGRIETGISPFLETQIVAMAKQLEKIHPMKCAQEFGVQIVKWKVMPRIVALIDLYAHYYWN